MKGITLLGVLIGFGGVMDIQNFVWILIDPAKLLVFTSEVLGWLNFYISLPVGLLSLIVAYGFFKGLSWGWALGLASSVLGTSISLVNLLGRAVDPITVTIIIINAFTVYYLTRPHVKKYFRKPVAQEPSNTT